MWIGGRMRMGARASPAYSFTRALAIPLALAIMLPWRCRRVRPEAPPDHRSQGCRYYWPQGRR